MWTASLRAARPPSGRTPTPYNARDLPSATGSSQFRVFVEQGAKRTFAGAVEWPGWCRSAKDEAGALDVLAAYAPRYRAAIKAAGVKFPAAKELPKLRVVERVPGTTTTDFGATDARLKDDDRRLDENELGRLTKLLSACWDAFDGSAEAASGVALAKGPRGGGRSVDAMRAHIFESERAYLGQLGGTFDPKSIPKAQHATQIRKAFLAALSARVRGELPDRGPRGGLRWTPQYAIRRSAWHSLDHAWEIQDRRLD